MKTLITVLLGCLLLFSCSDDSPEVSCEILGESQEADAETLRVLFEEITEISESQTCSDASNWTFAAYGSKACGGPQGYIAYSLDIDVDSFLSKIRKYTEAEALFNTTWSAISDCALANPPAEVICVDGKPSLGN